MTVCEVFYTKNANNSFGRSSRGRLMSRDIPWEPLLPPSTALTSRKADSSRSSFQISFQIQMNGGVTMSIYGCLVSMPVIGTEEFQKFFNTKFSRMIALAHKFDAILRLSRLSGLKPVGHEVYLGRVKK